MSERALKQLVGALALVAALWLVVTLISRSGGGAIEAPAALGDVFDGVDATSATAVRLIGTDDSIELRPENGAWKVNGFRADSGAVARLFQVLEDVTVGDLVATNPANHDRMGVSADSASTVEIDIGGQTRTILVGKAGPRPSTAYARLPGEDDVYLLEGNVRSPLTRSLVDWRNRRVVAIDTSRVARVHVQRDADDYTLVRGDSAWTFEDGSAADSSQVHSLLSELGGSAVASTVLANDDSLAVLPPGGSTVAYSQGGDVLTEITVGSGDGDRWAMAAGDSVRYRIARFRVDLITPTRESVTPEQ